MILTLCRIREIDLDNHSRLELSFPRQGIGHGFSRMPRISTDGPGQFREGLWDGTWLNFPTRRGLQIG